MTLLKFVSLAASTALAAGCSTSNANGHGADGGGPDATSSQGQYASLSIGPDGGSVSAAGAAAATIPAGALASSQTITITASPSSPGPADAVVVGPPYVFGPEGLSFAQPVTVTLAFDPSRLPVGAGPTAVEVFTAPAGSSTFVALSTILLDATHVVAQTTHFSVFVPAVPNADAGVPSGGSGAPSGATTGTALGGTGAPSGASPTGSGAGTGTSAGASTGAPDAGVDGGAVERASDGGDATIGAGLDASAEQEFASCAPGGPGMTNCGPGGAGTESCCTSLEVTGGIYYRTFANPPDAGPEDESAPATVSGFRLDKYMVTVGRFRQFVSAAVPEAGAGWLPAPGSGKHTHLNAGQGLADATNEAGVSYETGWVSSDGSNIALTAAGFPGACAATWTPLPSVNENLPITCVNWYEAYAFCIWDGGFLPSQNESQYAAVGGNQQRLYPWGWMDPGTANQYATCCETNADVDAIAPVGAALLGAGLWGQLDLAGDVWEWNLDWWEAEVDPCTDCADLTGYFTFGLGMEPYPPTRSKHGGAYYTSAAAPPYWGSQLTYGGTIGANPVIRDPTTGFRCSRAP